MRGADTEPRTLIDALLETQRRLTAVERFAQKHEREVFPSQARYYRDLIPLDRPRNGERYAFAVDLDACTGCKACVSACHSLNGLEDDELWRDVGLLHGGTAEAPYQQTITTACHHCADPACANGCPVLAYEQDEETGIVRHLDDQCIGCQYCVLKCPYDVPKFSAKKGIVRKCDMCQGRLAAGEAPACVQACPSGAITIEIVTSAGVLSSTANGATLVPGSFSSSYTRPATRFHSARPIPPNARAADADSLRLEDPHWPLAVMLILTQMAAGIHGAHAWLLARQAPAPFVVTAVAGLIALLIGMAVSSAHLGRPLKAWRAFLGWRKSWMSREILAFGAYAGSASALLLFPLNVAIAWGTLAIALISVACSAMIYIDTRRPAWAAARTGPKFFGTAALLGATTVAALLGWTAPALAPACAVTATVIRTALFAWEWGTFLPALRNAADPSHRAALTVARLLPHIIRLRVVLFLASTVSSVLAIFDVGKFGAVWGTLAFVTTVTSQFLERHMYFTASAAPRMPGGVPA